MGQIMRGFTMGGLSYGYESVPVGEIHHDKKGRLKADGYALKIVPEQAHIVKKIYREFVDGKSLNAIVKSLNQDKVPTRKRLRQGWCVSTISRMLRNEKYKGTYVWNRRKSVKDPMTGQTKQIPRPKSEWVIVDKPELKIVEPELWEKAQKRLEELKTIYPGAKGFGGKKSYVNTNPTSLPDFAEFKSKNQ